MVVTTVLGCSRLATYLIVCTIGRTAGSFDDRGTHACHNIFVGTFTGFGIMAMCVERVERLSLHLAYNVRGVVVASVGNGGAKIGNLQWREVHLSLSYGDTDDGKTVP